jgi:cyclophilin family peptidyl-prolyl cis-trans isomerase
MSDHYPPRSSAMLDLLRTFWRPRRSSRRRRAAISFGESLEARILLAGNVVADIVNGNLSLTGDAAANSVEITVVGDDLVVRGHDDTTINGASDVFVIRAGGTTFGGDVTVALAQSSDTLLISGPLTISGDLDVDDSSGSGHLGITDATIGGNVTVRSSKSADTVSLLKAEVEGDLFLHLGDGRNFVSLDDSNVAGRILVRTGEHADCVVLEGSTVGGLHAVTGRRNDEIILRNSTIDGDFLAFTGEDRDFVLMEDSTVTGDTQLWLGADSDFVVTQGDVEFGGHLFAGGIFGRKDAIELSDETDVAGKQAVVGFERRSISDLTGINERIQDRLVEAATIQTQLNGVDQGELTLTVDTSGNEGLVQSSDTLVTREETLLIEGMTLPFATISITAGGNGGLDLGSVVADSDGNYSLMVDLLHGPTTVMVTATDLLERTVTEQFDLHVAAGTVVRFDSSLGSFDVELYDEDTPMTVENFLDYMDRYIDSIVHRSAVNQANQPFVIQGGGFFLDGNNELQMIATDPPVVSEFTGEHSNVRGTLAMALSSDLFGNVLPNSGTSQWFVNLGDNSQLDADQFTVFGEVIGSGMEVVDAIAALDRIDINDVIPLTTAALNEVPLQNYTLVPVQLAGTVSIASGSIVVEGTGTQFTTQLKLNDLIDIDGLLYRIVDINSDTQLLVTDSAPMDIVDADYFTEPIATTIPTREQYVVFNSIGVLL